MIQNVAVQELCTKYSLTEGQSEELSRYLEQMRDLPSSISEGKMRNEHQRLRRVLRFLTRGNEELEQDVLNLLWQISTATKKRRSDERRETRVRRTYTQNVIEI